MTDKAQKGILISPNTKINPHIPTIFLIKNYITKPKIFIGDYTYYHDFNGEQAAIEFENKNIIYYRTSPHMYLWRKQWNWMSSTMLFKQNRIV
ncbi:hypothetical protein [Spiroplasma ixodetis]|uniref:hypothetical protein n=1 Tax=Spiroplasma ixodetis TaxID=2141 RepID=UPI002576E1B5|nr:hypothetical protein [Spiroplasma ixodetis]WJG71162.1 hypothetical protein SIXOD_v1c25130 [Spiroplasma ixodetis Y32]